MIPYKVVDTRKKAPSSESGSENFSTIAIRSGHERSLYNEHSEPIYETSSYVYKSASESASIFSGDTEGYIYSRFTNPTVSIFEKRIANLEYGEKAIASSSGMAAILSVCMSFLEAGDHIVCSRSVFGSTSILLKNYFQKLGVGVDFVHPISIENWHQKIKANTKLLFLESPSNPMMEITDIEALSTLANIYDLKLVVDNTFCSPYGQNPLILGAHLVIHSAGKYIDGQGRGVGGCIVGDKAAIQTVSKFMRCAGPCMTPHNAWVFLKGLETLSLRMERHTENAQILAEKLQRNKFISKVLYTGLPSHPQYALACRQQKLHGGVLSFELKDGNQARAWDVIDNLKLISNTTNLGDSKSMITHPYSTTHTKLSELEKQQAGIQPGLLRISVGLEDIKDIFKDIDCAIEMAMNK